MPDCLNSKSEVRSFNKRLRNSLIFSINCTLKLKKCRRKLFCFPNRRNTKLKLRRPKCLTQCTINFKNISKDIGISYRRSSSKKWWISLMKFSKTKKKINNTYKNLRRRTEIWDKSWGNMTYFWIRKKNNIPSKFRNRFPSKMTKSGD